MMLLLPFQFITLWTIRGNVPTEALLLNFRQDTSETLHQIGYNININSTFTLIHTITSVA
ncbi:uncharacterized protein PHALS_14692 [Plasmopara halstedii]|uniref:RxLR-like protein n=1 Tax=Plasmopara halstedii TaxID=4781 RepID=A0A0P1APH8_PLAHL|nr:uncharacterized protein PHALS_14692 [Plasmopara halstedii]CEG43232.1 hypothetical protein PHALS_14692 [Plasmopara halstedii]|eukprot:XP_024579601.1 hypothetical protein PHALS_14692 [Plasmopara halstedii]